jgi:low temperature requirement protein LtrA
MASETSGTVSAPAPPAHGAAEGERRTGPVELLWDLVFVFAVTQVTTLLSRDLTWSGFGRSMLVLALVWWAWSAFVWAANAHEQDAPVLRVVLLLATILIFITGISIPHAFGANATLFAATYVGVRLLHLALYADASRRGQAAWSAIAGFAVTVVIGMSLLLAGSFLQGWQRDVLWAAAVAIDYAGPLLTRERLRRLQEVTVSHFADRYGLFVLICLGESIAVIGLRASPGSLHAATIAGVLLGILVTIGLWWIYFDRYASMAEQRLREHREPVLAASDAYSYLHLPLVAGVIIFATGAKIVIALLAGDVGDSSLHDSARLALCGGVALYVLAHAAFLARLLGVVSWGRIALAAALFVLYGVSGGLSAWLVALLVALALALTCALDPRLTRGRAAIAPPSAA